MKNMRMTSWHVLMYGAPLVLSACQQVSEQSAPSMLQPTSPSNVPSCEVIAAQFRDWLDRFDIEQFTIAGRNPDSRLISFDRWISDGRDILCISSSLRSYLIESMRSGWADLRPQALLAAPEFVANDECLVILIRATFAEHSSIRRYGIVGLSKLGDPMATSRLCYLSMNDQDESVRATSCGSLARQPLGLNRRWPTWTADGAVEQWTIISNEQLAVREVLGHVIAIDESVFVRTIAIQVLDKLGMT